MDFNVDHYTVQELLDVLELPPDATPSAEEVEARTDAYIQRFEGEQRMDMVFFFQQVQTKLLRYLQQVAAEGADAVPLYQPDERQNRAWWKHEALPQADPVQRSKLTDRVQKIDVYDDQHMPMKRQQLGVQNAKGVPVAQDVLNPNLENITSRFINLDSQYRQASANDSATDYVMDLSDPLTNVLSMRLYSIQIPYTWYGITEANSCLWVANEGALHAVRMAPGNYSPAEFCAALNSAFLAAGFAPPPAGATGAATGTATGTATGVVSYVPAQGKVRLSLAGWTDPAGRLVSGVPSWAADEASLGLGPTPPLLEEAVPATGAYWVFFHPMGCNPTCAYTQTYDTTLGWAMGFRAPLAPVQLEGNAAEGVLNLFGTKYFILVIDDFNQNHVNNNLVTITEPSTRLRLPSYYNASLPYTCVPLPQAGAGGGAAALASRGGAVQQLLPSAPRTLTQSQLYTINEIQKNNHRTASFRSKAPTNADTFAIVPIKYGSMSTGQLYTELSGQFQDNKRVYFGPVNIERMRIRLLDDKGQAVDLHGGDWCVTLISENLYQY